MNTWLSRTATVRLKAPTTQSWPHFPLGTPGRTNEPCPTMQGPSRPTDARNRQSLWSLPSRRDADAS
eukprot:10251634-Alexandrium_andersonii.AAC.1